LKTIGFIGAGQMAKSLACGISKLSGTDIQLLISDPSEPACASFEKLIGTDASVTRVQDNQELVSASEVVFLAVKPQYLEEATEDLDFSKTSPLLVSIVAGARIRQLERLTNTKRIIRVMPNTPCLIGEGASAMTAAQNVDPGDVATVKGYLESVGTVVEVEEHLMDSVTGLSGSGPAYVFSFIEALIEGAVLTGMPRDIARQLAVQTVVGAATMIRETGEHPAVLRDRVTSPGGTTIEGLKALEENSFRDAVMSAVQAATERAGELG
jgi:pyrroline-5-carboxylate reductase